ncbi:hypothetical protein WNY51_13740 [Pseudocolwellia sp. AS88]|uniref:hypothetical protein n=1 Tax=Pseudocolwellia sp. AS88 TaxID=3063958 RepID=UPI0026EA9CBB|nr:hypothetical protein [Pseudocolwellia sp. AS88]MDO7083972.1 hypothetical protein [Pseudocolwellia sp. AS88]
MKVIPYDSFTIDTTNPPEIIVTNISKNIGSKNFGLFEAGNEYKGSITDNRFTIQKNISYQNSFLPIIQGEITLTDKGSSVNITMRPHALVLCFMSIWFFCVGLGCLLVLSNLDNFSLPYLIPFGMLFFGITLILLGFWPEAKKQKPKLIELIKENK